MSSLRINVIVHEEENPELYAYLQSLPTNSHRRHGRILALLNAGISVAQGVIPSSFYRLPVGVPSVPSPLVSEAKAPPPPPVVGEVIDVDEDLLSLFAGSGTSSTEAKKYA